MAKKKERRSFMRLGIKAKLEALKEKKLRMRLNGWSHLNVFGLEHLFRGAKRIVSGAICRRRSDDK